MQYIRLGATGMTVSRLCLGCMSYGDGRTRKWTVGEPEAREHFRIAIDAGVTFFDTADSYSLGVSEEITGRCLAEMASRDDIVISTKVCSPMGPGPNRRGLSRKHVIEACHASLRRLGTDFIDLYQIHRWDDATPIEETLEALDALVRAGKVRYLGASSMAAWQFAKALQASGEHGWSRFVSMQNHYNLIYREEEREMIPLCIDRGIALIPWSPVARGYFELNRARASGGAAATERARTDEVGRDLYQHESDAEVALAVRKVAAERGFSPTQIALAWVLHMPWVTAPIVGATRAEHLRQAIAAIDIRLSAEEMASLETPYRPHPVRGHDHPEPRLMRRPGR